MEGGIVTGVGSSLGHQGPEQEKQKTKSKSGRIREVERRDRTQGLWSGLEVKLEFLNHSATSKRMDDVTIFLSDITLARVLHIVGAQYI